MAGKRTRQGWGAGFRPMLRGGLLAALALTSVGCASIAEHQRNVAEQRNTSLLERKIWETDAFLRHHPDIKHRKLGFWYQQQGDQARSLSAFEEAARHADKPSQAILAEWYFEGRTVAQDLPRAYAFMDLAAERGYPLYLAKREQYWAALDQAGREQALAIGAELYAEYGDDVAKPRMARALRFGRMGATGSRLGAAGMLEVLVPVDGMLVSLPGDVYYRPHFWREDRYFEWFDTMHRDPPRGEVEVGPIAPKATQAAARSPG